MFKNWKAICKLPDSHFCLFTASVEKPNLLEGLQRGFPELFCEEEQNPKIPISHFDAYLEDTSTFLEKREDDGFLSAEDLCRCLHIPVITLISEEEKKQFKNNKDPIIPEGLKQSLADLEHDSYNPDRELMKIIYEGIPCLVWLHVKDDCVVFSPASCFDLEEEEGK